jgi:hypothetical protein
MKPANSFVIINSLERTLTGILAGAVSCCQRNIFEQTIKHLGL